jgi:hypothetical protein
MLGLHVWLILDRQDIGRWNVRDRAEHSGCLHVMATENKQQQPAWLESGVPTTGTD